MIKRLLILMLLSFSALSLDAQILKASFGIKGAGVGTMVSTEKDMTYCASVGGGGGAFLGFKLANFLGVQAEAIYAKQTVNYDFDDYDDITTYHGMQTYLLVPAVAQLWLGRSVAFEVGIQKAIGKEETMSKGNKVPDGAIGLQDYDCYIAGINFNLGKVGVLDFRYLRGIEDSYSKGYPGVTQSVQVSLGFRLFSSKKHLFK